MVAHAFNSSPQETETGRGQPHLHSQFQITQGYLVKLCLKERKEEREWRDGGREEKRETFPSEYVERLYLGKEG